MRNQTSDWISEDFHILGGRDCLAGIKIDMLTERKFSVEYKTQVFPGVFGEKNRSTKGRNIEWREVKKTMWPWKMKDFSFGMFNYETKFWKKIWNNIITTEK